MKKILILMLAFGICYGQTGYVKSKILRYKQPQYATVLNGTNQSWSKTTPSNLDLNGSEMITNTSNSGFVDSLGNWSAFAGGNHTAVRSTVDKKAGVASMAITSSAAGDTTANFIYIPASNLGTITSGAKYTLELWARSATATTTISMYLGTQGKTSGNLSTTFGSFTKVSFNFTANGLEDTLKLYLSKAVDTCYVDSVSFTQAYDALVLQYLYTNSTATQKTFGHGNISSTEGCYGLLYASGNLQFRFRDNTTATNTSDAISINTKYHIAVAVNRTSTMTTYINGVAGTPVTISALGRMIPATKTLYVGIGTDSPFSGWISYTQVIRFTSLPSDIANVIARVKMLKKPLNSYSNGQVVFYVDWKSGARDLSASGNNLTGSGSPPIVRLP